MSDQSLPTSAELRDDMRQLLNAERAKVKRLREAGTEMAQMIALVRKGIRQGAIADTSLLHLGEITPLSEILKTAHANGSAALKDTDNA